MKVKKVFLVVLICALLTAGFTLLTSPRPSEHTLRHLAAGDVIGFEDKNGIFAWLGIPFARPPVGELRWRAPRPVASWDGVLEALEHSPMCPQFVPFDWVKPLIMVGEEDCLYLNVWTPALDPAELADARLPVMVWIHGGANTLGGSSAADPYRFAARENVIVVSIQYRLGILGWFSHSALRNTASGPLDQSSNFALLDMIAALHWVRDNIGPFGGDPDNVTLFGQSAGAFDIIALLAAPQAKKLFHRAIAQSGTLDTIPQSRAENYIDDQLPGLPHSSREYINKMLVAEGLAIDRDQARAVQDSMEDEALLDHLRAKSTEELFRSVDRRGMLGYFTPSNIRDGIVLPEASLMEVFADPQRYNRVPVLLGSNREEFKLWLWSSPRFTEWRFGLIPRLRDVDEYNRMARYFSDQWQAIGVNEPARVLHRSQPGEVFAYRFDWADQPTIAGVDMSTLFGAAHGIEVAFLFGREAVATLPMFAIASDASSRDELGETMASYWANFARTGNPSGVGDSGLVEWTPWREVGARKMVFDSSRQQGVRMTEEAIFIADLKERLREDPAIESQRDRCQLYAQLFYYSLSSDFWDEQEYERLGCAAYPRETLRGVF